MDQPTIHRRRYVLSDRNMLEAVGETLGDIRKQDGLTWLDVGKVLGVGDDSASAYASGFTAMNICAFGRGKHAWGGRFTGPFDRLVLGSRPGSPNGQTAINHILSAVSAINMAMRDGEITAHQLREHRSTLDVARDQIDELLRLAGDA